MKAKNLLAGALALTLVFSNGVILPVLPNVDSAVVASAASENVKLDGDTLVLSGNVTAEDILPYSVSNGNDVHEKVKKIIAKEGTVLPADCTKFFFDFPKCTEIDLSKADTSKVTNMSNMFGF